MSCRESRICPLCRCCKTEYNGFSSTGRSWGVDPPGSVGQMKNCRLVLMVEGWASRSFLLAWLQLTCSSFTSLVLCSHGCLASAHLVGRSLTHTQTQTRAPFYCCFHQPSSSASCGSSQSERGSLLSWKSHTANEGFGDWDRGCEYEGEQRSDRVICLLLIRNPARLVYSGLETLILKLFI